MKTVMVRYKTKPEHARANEKLVRAVFTALEKKDPGGIRYASYRLPDGVTFVHLALLDGAKNPLGSLPEFEAFSSTVAERCDEPPVVHEIEPIGSYGF